ncbi:hypothetical protein SAMN05421869_117121 [Nonomuraea jiangxiensis]|uniref:Uncharacterized protein n=1 Tax=Nonomuraea jiangxiensis TaxID=633440 RepID=A0A1G9DFA8_9ACTN|nr:hypothetical protein SAMN05421869_117121 [Nonomuraea jiangxiensis]
MKLVTTGMSSRNERTMSRSARKHSSRASEVKRLKSSLRAGFIQVRGMFGTSIWSQSV